MSSNVGFINNACNVPLNENSGTMPDVSTALTDWYQVMTFGVITKSVVDFQNVESVVETTFLGVWQPLQGRQLKMQPEGQRQWSSWSLYTQREINLKIDDIVIYLTRQYRVIAKKNFNLEQMQYYELIQDWESSGPPTP